MRYARFVLVLIVATYSSACFQFSTVLKVNGDGSGTIQQHMLFTRAALVQLQQFATMTGGRGSQNFDPLSEQQARNGASSFGPGVTYLSSMPIDGPDGQGRDITYAFKDVSQLRLAQTPPAPGGMSVSAPNLGTDAKVAFSFARATDGTATLKVLAPQLADQATASGQLPSLGGGMASPEQLALVRPMFAGARVMIAVEPNGQLLRTNSAYVDGGRVTLLAVDLDSLLADDALLQRLQAARTPDERRELLKKVPGLKVNPEPEVTISFKP